MKLFISYPSDQKELAERLRLALEAEGHEVFTDRAELKEGEPYHAALREAIEGADAMLFLITPRSIHPGSYALTELDLAQRRWRRPGGHVLPVIAAATPVEDIPPYLRAVTLLQPKGDLVAETVAAVARLRSRSTRRLSGNSSPPSPTEPRLWWGSQFLSPLIPTMFFSARVTPVFLWVLSLGRLTMRSAERTVSARR